MRGLLRASKWSSSFAWWQKVYD